MTAVKKTKKRNLTTEERSAFFGELEAITNLFSKNAETEMGIVRHEFEKMAVLLSRCAKDLNKFVLEAHKKFSSFEEELAKVKNTNENAEETLINVLVAIRQNEYLQAWAPPQHGYGEVKIVGSHPSKVAAKNAWKKENSRRAKSPSGF